MIGPKNIRKTLRNVRKRPKTTKNDQTTKHAKKRPKNQKKLPQPPSRRTLPPAAAAHVSATQLLISASTCNRLCGPTIAWRVATQHLQKTSFTRRPTSTQSSPACADLGQNDIFPSGIVNRARCLAESGAFGRIEGRSGQGSSFAETSLPTGGPTVLQRAAPMTKSLVTSIWPCSDLGGGLLGNGR